MLTPIVARGVASPTSLDICEIAAQNTNSYITFPKVNIFSGYQRQMKAYTERIPKQVYFLISDQYCLWYDTYELWNSQNFPIFHMFLLCYFTTKTLFEKKVASLKRHYSFSFCTILKRGPVLKSLHISIREYMYKNNVFIQLHCYFSIRFFVTRKKK